MIALKEWLDPSKCGIFKAVKVKPYEPSLFSRILDKILDKIACI